MKQATITPNVGPIDETSLSNGELYTILTNREKHGGKGSIVAVVSGTKSEDVMFSTKLQKVTKNSV